MTAGTEPDAPEPKPLVATELDGLRRHHPACWRAILERVAAQRAGAAFHVAPTEEPAAVFRPERDHR